LQSLLPTFFELDSPFFGGLKLAKKFLIAHNSIIEQNL